MTTSTFLLVLFIIMSVAHLVAENAESLTGRFITKPCLMLLLALYYIAAATEPNYLLVAAIAFGWLGDIFLMIPDPKKTQRFFKPGLAAFLIGHILYIAVFAAYLPRAAGVPVWGWAALAVYAAVGFIGYRLIGPHTGKLRPAIIAYVVIIVLMSASTVLPLGSVRTTGALMAMTGALIFMVSDTVNAYNIFVGAIPNERLYTMSTYIAGQFLLVQGYLLF